jgi:hypothetical protein
MGASSQDMTGSTGLRFADLGSDEHYISNVARLLDGYSAPSRWLV